MPNDLTKPPLFKGDKKTSGAISDVSRFDPKVDHYDEYLSELEKRDSGDLTADPMRLWQLSYLVNGKGVPANPGPDPEHKD